MNSFGSISRYEVSAEHNRITLEYAEVEQAHFALSSFRPSRVGLNNERTIISFDYVRKISQLMSLY